MRQAKFIVTKNHFVLLASSDQVGDELWSGYSSDIDVQSTNAIGFMCQGEVSAFLKANNNWNKYIDVKSPFGLVRPDYGSLGIASKTEVARFGAVVPKEFYGLNQLATLYIATNQEENEINDGNNMTVELDRKCKFYEKRDLNTFEIIPLDANNVISSSDIEIEGI